jgi:hypothetical protein
MSMEKILKLNLIFELDCRGLSTDLGNGSGGRYARGKRCPKACFGAEQVHASRKPAAEQSTHRDF